MSKLKLTIVTDIFNPSFISSRTEKENEGSNWLIKDGCLYKNMGELDLLLRLNRNPYLGTLQ